MGILTKSKNGFYTIPAIASALFPGVGQIIKGQIGKGIAFFALSFIWGYLMWFPNLVPWFGGAVVFIASVLAWAINVLDAGFNSVGQRY